ncbi:protein PHYTOCHROME KINASE SUBSTRATE 1-like [Bidens hawaiensis]|uniref:protein PHYTOCHROME KINASE SUBSTRATE 1-like n=1 Tax=Bidens hawaiensis TaxID=980011 RepID=UPI004049A505
MIASNASPSHSNKDTTKERSMPKLAEKSIEDDELGVFEAEKYFKGVIDEEHLRTSNNIVHHHSNRPRSSPKSKSMSRACSESSSNSMRGLLVSNTGNIKPSKKPYFKNLLASIGCNCNNKDSVMITKLKHPLKGKNKKGEILELSRKGGHEAKGEILERSRNKEQNDTGSDASSDLFEIGNFLTNENNLFLARQAIDDKGYAPSEVSVVWSVVTTSVSSFPNVSGGKKVAVVTTSTGRDWCHRLDSVTPVAKIQAHNKLICKGDK